MNVEEDFNKSKSDYEFIYLIYCMIDNPFEFERDSKKFTNSLEHDRNATEEEDDK